MPKKPNKDHVLAKKYEAAWHKLFYKADKWKQECIINEPHGRHAEELSREAAMLAESDKGLDLLLAMPNSGSNTTNPS